MLLHVYVINWEKRQIFTVIPHQIKYCPIKNKHFVSNRICIMNMTLNCFLGFFAGNVKGKICQRIVWKTRREVRAAALLDNRVLTSKDVTPSLSHKFEVTSSFLC